MCLANKESASTRSAISVPQGCWLIGTEFSVGTGFGGILRLEALDSVCLGRKLNRTPLPICEIEPRDHLNEVGLINVANGLGFEPVGGELLNHAAIGVWYKPPQCFCHR